MYIQRKSTRRIAANDDIGMEESGAVGGEGDVSVDPEATDLLFEAEDVAELVAEVTGEAVDVTVEDDSVTFAVGEDEYTVQAEGDEEILEASRKPLRGKSRVAASSRVKQTAPNSKVIRKLPSRRGR